VAAEAFEHDAKYRVVPPRVVVLEGVAIFGDAFFVSIRARPITTRSMSDHAISDADTSLTPALPLALAYETPDPTTDRRDRDVLRLACVCVIAALCSLGCSLIYFVNGAVRGTTSLTFLFWMPVIGVIAVAMICCLAIRPWRGQEAAARRRVMRWWWIAFFAEIATALVGTVISIVMYRSPIGLGVEVIARIESALSTASQVGYLLLVPLLFDRPADVYRRRLSLLATVLITCTAVATMLELGISLARMYSNDLGNLPNMSALELVRQFAVPLGYTAAAAMLIGWSQSEQLRSHWLTVAGALAGATWLVTIAIRVGHPWYQWQSLKTGPMVFLLSWMTTLSVLLWTFGPLALLMRFTWGRSDAQLADLAERDDQPR
jgi:hypothetical protein